MVLQMYQDQAVLEALRTSMYTIRDASRIQDYSNFPLLESVYTETLRLRTEAYITRRFPHKDTILGDRWLIPRNKICLASTHPSHHDTEVWNTAQC
jgi:cytochrome P450